MLTNDVEVLNNLARGSDNWLVRSKVVINMKLERYKMIKKKQKPN